MSRPVNPYIAGNPVGNSTAFVGRVDVLRAVLRVLGDPQHHGIVLYGQRRIGKTSILQQLAEWLPKQGGPRAIYFDLQDKAAWSVGRIVEHLAMTIADALDLPDPVAGAEPEVWFQREWLPAVLDRLGKGKSLVVLLDEFDVLTDVETQRTASATFFGYLRELLASVAPRLGFVFVIGRNLEDLSYLAQPLFKTFPAERVSLLSRGDAEVLMRMSEANGSLAWSEEATAAAWALTRGHPYLLQHLCWQVWQQAYDAQSWSSRVEANDVEAAVPRTLEASRNALEWLWGGLPPAERVVASALAEAGPGVIAQEGLFRVLHESGVRVVIRELRDAPRLLQEWDLIEPMGGGFQFRVELLRRWIAQFKPLGRVQQELDHVQPLAENLYRAGEGFYRAGDLDRAMGQLRQAIGINPNHLRASELLAEILISREEWEEARRLLEGMYENHPADARPRLVQVLLAQAQRTRDEGEELELYDRVLKLSPKEATAAAGKQRIWKERGDRARGSGQLEDAMAAYRQSALPELEKNVRDEIRATRLAGVVEDVYALERAGDYAAALERIRGVGDIFAGLRDWAADIARIERASVMAVDYLQACQALWNGDRKTATDLLAKVIAIDPGYKEAAARLYEAVSGVSVHHLTANAADEMQARTEAEEQRDIARRGWDKMIRVVWVASSVAAVAVLVLTVQVLGSGGNPRKTAEVASVVATTSATQASLSAPLASASAIPPLTPISIPALSPDAGACLVDMTWIPGGTFMMGSNDGEDDEKPPHSVKVTGFFMDTTEVTVAAYLSCSSQGVMSQADKGSNCNGTRSDRQDHPMNCVTWTQADTYCKTQGKRLPTEEEWEYAARGGSEQRLYPWGRNAPLNKTCWNGAGNDLGKGNHDGTCPVGKYPLSDSKWGLHDLAGNVLEWTASPYCPYESSGCHNVEYVLRGGSWSFVSSAGLRSSFRFEYGPSVSINSVGFRCARTPNDHP